MFWRCYCPKHIPVRCGLYWLHFDGVYRLWPPRCSYL